MDGTHLYWTDGDTGGAIMRANKDGTEEATLVSGLSSPVLAAVSP